MIKLFKKFLLFKPFLWSSLFLLCWLLVLQIPEGDSIFYEIVYGLFGFVGYLVLPGWWIFQRVFRGKSEDILESIVYIILLSVSVVTILAFYGSFLGVPITRLSVWTLIVIIVCLSCGGIMVKAR